MGADLYFTKPKAKKIWGFERSKNAVADGYYRDAYNDGSILWKYGLSWWADITKLQNKEGIISVANIKKFRAMLNDTLFNQNIAECKADKKKYYKEGADLLKDYLDTAIKTKTTIDASL